MSTATPAKQFEPEDLLRMPDGDRYELVDGELVERTMSLWAGYVAGQVFRRLDTHAQHGALGWVTPEVSYQCFPDAPKKVRKPDVSFISAERLSLAEATEEGHVPIHPDLAVEVLSPNDLAYEVEVSDFLAAGVRLVWVINPEVRTVAVHRPDGPGAILHAADELDGENVLPGFRCPIADLFKPPPGVRLQ